MASLADTNKVMAYLSALWPREPVSQATIKAYHTVLKDLDADAITAAAEKLAGESTFFPKAAELRQTAFDIQAPDDLPLAIEGWHQLEMSWRGGSKEWHELTGKTVNALGGWNRLGMTLDKDIPFLRARFIKTFETYRKRLVDERRQLPSVREYKQLQAGKVDDAIKQLLQGKKI